MGANKLFKKNYVYIILLMILAGCADMDKYYAADQKRTEAILGSIESQVAANNASRLNRETRCSQAMISAARTPSNTDDVVVAYNCGADSTRQYSTVIPNLPSLKAPSDGVDYLRAGVPYANLIFPWLVGAYGERKEQSPSLTATDNATILFQSANPSGSHNNLPINIRNNCTDDTCEDGVGGIETLPTDCETNPPAGFNPSGNPLAAPDCSCESRALGKC